MIDDRAYIGCGANPLGPRWPVGRAERERVPKTNRKGFGAAANILLALIGLLISVRQAVSQNTSDWITGLPRETVHVRAWPGERKVAVCFVLYVEVWGFGHGPNFRPDTAARDPDVVDEAFRQYAIDWGIPRVGRVFKEQDLPLSIALNALFPEKHPDVWKQFRALVPKAPIVAHGVNNSTELLPLGRGLDAQRAYIRRTLDLIEKDTGVRSHGWSSPSDYPNADTFTATAAEGIGYSLDAMDSDVLSRLITKSGPLVLIPYPVVTVDMGQHLERSKDPSDMERMWIDYVSELASEAAAYRIVRPRSCDRHPSLCGWDARRRRRIAPRSQGFQETKACLGDRCSGGTGGRRREALAAAEKWETKQDRLLDAQLTLEIP